MTAPADDTPPPFVPGDGDTVTHRLNVPPEPPEVAPPATFPELHTRLEKLGADHVGVPTVLLELGRAHAAAGDDAQARLFFGEALRRQRKAGDQEGLAAGFAHLGRLELEWGRPDEAEPLFRNALTLSRKAEPRMLATLRYQRALALLGLNRQGEAAALLREAQKVATLNWPRLEAQIRAARALAHRAAGESNEAEDQCARASAWAERHGQTETLALVLRARGLAQRDRGRLDDSAVSLTTAAGHFDRAGRAAECARTQAELARTLRAAGAPVARIAAALLAGWEAARRGRRDDLSADLEEKLALLAPREYLATLDAAASEADGKSTHAAVVAVRLEPAEAEPDYAVFLKEARRRLADLATTWTASGLTVTRSEGDGLVAVRPGADAAPAIAAARAALASTAEWNRPRRVLGWPERTMRAAVASGSVALGRGGPERLAGVVAIGPAKHLVLHLREHAGPGELLLCPATKEQTAVTTR